MGSLKRKIVVLVPFPFQGHITPMLQLGSILHSKGFSIVVIHTEFNSPNPSNHPEFTFLPLSDNLEGYDMSFHNMLNVISAMNTNCRAQFQDYIVQILEEDKQEMKGERKVEICIIHDIILHFADTVANHLDIPNIVLRTSNAASMHSFYVFFHLLEEKLIPLSEFQLQDKVPNAYPLRYKDLPLPASSEIPEVVLDFTRSYMNIKSSSAVIWNTVDILENSSLLQLQEHYKVPFFTIGPFHKMVPSLHTTSLMREDTACLSWLDKQAPNSVIYVSLGSLATIQESDLIEMAWGLANSDQQFLWVIRPSLVNGSEWIECLPQDFKEKTQDRGCIVKWAPQKMVLSHPGVGGFLSHCGWNSTLESICEGVPMICKPCFSDQLVNARYLTHVWKVALELENSSDRVSIEKAVRTLMISKEGNEMRQRAMDMKQDVELSVQSGGSSYNSLSDLVEFINTHNSGKK